MSTATAPSQSLTELIGQLRSYLISENGSALTETELLELQELLSAFPIEIAEDSASQKQLDFQRKFFNRADDNGGRKLDIFVAMGANRCLGPNTLIESPDGYLRPVSSITQPHRVWAWNGSRRVVALADTPFIKAYEPCYRVTLSNGNWFECSANHLLLDATGVYRSLSSLLPLYAPSRLASSAELCRSTPASGGLSSNRIVQGSRCDYRRSLRCDDGQPRASQESGQGEIPSQADAQERTGRNESPSFGHEGDRADREECNRTYRRSSHLSIRGVARLLLARLAEFRSRLSGIVSRCAASHNEGDPQPMPECALPLQSTGEFDRSATRVRDCDATALMSPDGPTAIVSYESIGVQPIYDFHVPGYNNYVTCGAIHHNSGKTVLCGGMCFCKFIRDRARDGDLFWCVGTTLQRSIGGQQRDLWTFLPRALFGDQVWDEKGGFGHGEHAKLVLPTGDGGKCTIEFRSGDQAPTTFEQAKLRGIWCDERLSEAIFDRILARIIDLDGFILYSDIPEQWWHVSRLKDADPAAGVLYQWFEMRDNAANLPLNAITQAMARMTADEQRMRIHGEHIVMEGVVYREYIDLHKADGGHLVKPFPIPLTWPRWRLIDYGGSAPTAGLWVAIAPNEHVYAYREHYEKNLSIAKNAAMMIEASGDESYVETFMDPHAVDQPPAYYGETPTISKQYENAGINSTGWPFVNVMGERALVQRVKFRLERKTLWVFDTLINFRREFKSWKYDCDADGKPKDKDVFEKANNHLLDDIKGFLATNPCFTQSKVEVYG